MLDGLQCSIVLAVQAQKVGGCPWSLSFSFGRALQASVLKLWSADQTAVAKAKQVAEDFARVNGLAAEGKYQGPHPSVLDA